MRLLPHVEVDVGMIVRRQHTNAIKSEDADLDAIHAHLVEEQRHLKRSRAISQRTFSSIRCPTPPNPFMISHSQALPRVQPELGLAHACSPKERATLHRR